MDDTISRRAAIDAVTDELDMIDHVPQWVFDRLEKRLKQLSSAQPEITDEQAIEHLQSTGWMQNHDREMYYMGLKKQLADDSGSYDSLLSSAQPEQKGYTKAEYIMALHKEYGVDFARAEEAHNRALEYLRSTAMMKG